MVGKIIKHELYALFRILVFLFAAVLLLAVLLRLTLLGGNGASAERAGFAAFLAVFYIYAMFAAILVALILGISRFYKTIFTGEGYLTLSFPATPAQLIWGKLLSALIAAYSAVAVCILSALIFFAGLDAEFYVQLGDLLADLFSSFGAYYASDPLLIVEQVIVTIVVIPTGTLFFFLIASVGQLFTSHRKGMTALIAIAAIFVISLLNALVYEPILFACAQNISIHLANWIDILVTVAIDVGCFLLVRYILSHKVNLIV